MEIHIVIHKTAETWKLVTNFQVKLEIIFEINISRLKLIVYKIKICLPK